MGKILAFIGAGIIAFVLTSGIGFSGDGDGAGSGFSGVGNAQSRACLRQMRPLVSAEEDAVKACECVSAEFASRGLDLTDAFGSDFDEMSRITRSCAQSYGAQLPPM